jgi:hypothetical protein
VKKRFSKWFPEQITEYLTRVGGAIAKRSAPSVAARREKLRSRKTHTRRSVPKPSANGTIFKARYVEPNSSNDGIASQPARI